MITRREFLKLSGLVGASLAFPMDWLSHPLANSASSEVHALKKFIQPLRALGPSGLPIMTPDQAVQPWWQPGVTHYTIDIGQFEDQLHPDLPSPTRLWGFGQAGNFKHLGGVIAVQRGTPVQITFRNNLPPDHILPVDTTIMGADGPRNRCDIHLHGGKVPWTSDGGPHAWWDPNGNHGKSFVNVLNPNLGPAEAENYYPNDQGARILWYHDHALGITRLNAYAGIASAYVITDGYEQQLVAQNHLPGPLDPRTVYLVFQDKTFVSTDIEQTDPTWPKLMPRSRPGDLWYPHVYDPDRWQLAQGGMPPDPSCVPEGFGDTILVNGAVYPFLEVEQRQYRLRLLNACNGRFLNPRLVYAKGPSFPACTEPSNKPGPAFIQIGSEGGFLPHPTMLGGPHQPLLLLSPAERADLIVDFRDVPAGSTLLLYSDAPAPFPMGDDRNDYFPGNDKNPTPTQPGFGPNTRTLLQVRVKARQGAADPPVSLPSALHPTDAFLIDQRPGQPTAIPQGMKVRRLTLNETADDLGRLIQFLGTDQPLDPTADTLEFGREYRDQPTEVIHAGDSEVWEIANLTGDTHPIHFHLVNVQVLSRQPIKVDGYQGGQPEYCGPETAPDPNELGWKETVRMNPREVTRVLLKFDLPAVPFTIPPSPRLQKEFGLQGAEYVWHCHILEHEEHDMMRPIVVV